MVTSRWFSKRLVTGLLLGAVLTGAILPGDVAWSALSGEQAEKIAGIEGYLTRMRSLKAPFTQINPNGTTSTGMLYYTRPDKMRLDYHAPNPVLLVANGSIVLYHDRKLDQVSHLLTSQTPLAFLLKKDVKLSGDVTVRELEEIGGELVVNVVQTEDPDQGSITLVFGQNPLELRRWTVVDPQGQTTSLILETPQVGTKIDERLYVLCDPNATIKLDACE